MLTKQADTLKMRLTLQPFFLEIRMSLFCFLDQVLVVQNKSSKTFPITTFHHVWLMNICKYSLSCFLFILLFFYLFIYLLLLLF